MGPLIDNDDFWVWIRGHGSRTSLTDLIGSLMVRAEEVPGDRFHEAAGQLHALLDSAGGGDATAVPGNLDVGYDAVLFHGLCLEEEIDIGGASNPFTFWYRFGRGRCGCKAAWRNRLGQCEPTPGEQNVSCRDRCARLQFAVWHLRSDTLHYALVRRCRILFLL